jgi:hypothetical protein
MPPKHKPNYTPSEKSRDSPHLLPSTWRGGKPPAEGRWRYDLERGEVGGRRVVVEGIDNYGLLLSMHKMPNYYYLSKYLFIFKIQRQHSTIKSVI